MYIIELKKVNKDDIELVGGKGANLGELIKNNVCVPEGFVVTTHAYMDFLKENEIDKIIKELYINDNKEYKTVREKICNGKFPEKMLSEIKMAYEKLEERNRTAIRSSATAEDLDNASFAGQQETYLNVCGIDAVIQRIKDCFASCFSDRSVEYRKNAGYDYNDVRCAVVIQQMIESDVSGVMFTANVLNGEKEQILINSSYGLGEAVVSGIVSPDEYVLDAQGNIISKIIGSKAEKIIYGDKETIKVKVDEEESRKWSLQDNELQEICCIGKNIEKIYNKSMDIEWAKKDGKIYILQARAITTLDNIKKNNEMKIELSDIARKNLAFTLEHLPHAYYPLDYEISMIFDEEKKKIGQSVGMNMGGGFEIDENGVVKLSIPKEESSQKSNSQNFFEKIKEYTNISNNRKKGKEILSACIKELEKIECINIEKYDLTDCKELFIKLQNIQKDIVHSRFRYFIFPSMLIGKKLSSYLKGKYAEYDLLGDLSYKTYVINKDFNNLAKKLSEGSSFNEEYKEEKKKEFLRKHGYKSEYNSYPFSGKSWNEDIEGFEKLLNAKMKQPDNSINSGKYKEVLEFLKENYKEEEKELTGIIEYYRECHVYREESQYMWEKCFALFRKVLNQVSKSLNIRTEELWFLKYSELLQLCDTKDIDDNYLDKIERRKEHRKESEKYWDYLRFLVCDTRSDAKILNGVSGSSGIINGTACVILSKDDFYKLKKGDILVCRCTSPEWTPLFSLASAVVSDTGGALSHAAIVAREYGIPAVLGIGNATDRIKNGDNICVDGVKGIVMLLDE